MAKDEIAGRRFQISLRALMVLCIVFGLLFAYVGSYYRISRRGMREAEEHGEPVFFYVPYHEVTQTNDLTIHFRWMTFYAPPNWIDRLVFRSLGCSSAAEIEVRPDLLDRNIAKRQGSRGLVDALTGNR